MAVVVNLNEEREARTVPSLDRLGDLTIADMAGVNRVILEQMKSPVLLIPQLAGHIIAAGGKRLRPMLTLSSARLCGYQGERATPRGRVQDILPCSDEIIGYIRRGQKGPSWGMGNEKGRGAGTHNTMERRLNQGPGKWPSRILKVAADYFVRNYIP